MSELTLTVNGQEATVPLKDVVAALPDGHVLFHNDGTTVPDGFMRADRFQAELKRRTGEIENRFEGFVNPSDLDDEAFRKAATSRGIELGADGRVVSKVDSEALARLHGDWSEKHLKPKQAELDAALTEVDRMRRVSLVGRVMHHMREEGTAVQEQHLTSLFDDETPAFVSQVVKRMEYDAKERKHFYRDASGNPALRADGSYAGISDLLKELRAKDTNFRYFKDTRGSGSGFNGSAPSVGQKDRLARLRGMR